MTTEMRKLVEELCSPACAGRKPGTKGGDAARAAVCDTSGALPDPLRNHASRLVGMLESKLA
ncbi:hypothetical protein [Polyangium mundeleinium]|uniref:Uncharacterized protein n=1 Tax=Polyangium mundeleinium TaxID=2995306 RepID=A0ABT5F3K0_9BACT|nr:hypothetical protein [Polyangium mundeleinium]MDC0748209.1 hypothetical protein [Polyangium mundeleinium]